MSWSNIDLKKRSSQPNKTMLSSKVTVWTAHKKSTRTLVEIMHDKVTSMCHVTPWMTQSKGIMPHIALQTHD